MYLISQMLRMEQMEHILLFSEGVDGQNPYTNDVTVTGNPGTAGASTTIVVGPGTLMLI